MASQADLGADVTVVGAGVAGTTIARALALRGLSVALLDTKHPCAPCFKAEKMWPGNLTVFEKYGMKDVALSVATPIREVVDARAGRVLQRIDTGEFAMHYHDLVNALRAALPSEVKLAQQRVAGITLGAEKQRVTLQGGGAVESRLVVLATGGGGNWHDRLGFVRTSVRDGQSTCFGFDVAPRGGESTSFGFDSLTLYASSFGPRIGYCSFFRIGSTMRANMFVFRSPKDEWVKRMVRAPHDALCDAFEGIEKVMGAFDVTSKVETAGIDLWTLDPPMKDGIVLVGDAAQSVCPSTGTGLDKVLSDVQVLCSEEHIFRWLATPGMGADKIASYYADPRKIQVDRYSMQKAHYQRWLGASPSFGAALHREKLFLEMRLTGWQKKIWTDRSYVAS